MIAAAHQRLLRRTPDIRDLMTGSTALRNGTTLQTLIAELAKSADFRNSLEKRSDSFEGTIRLCYDRLLARVPNEDDVRELTKVAEQDGWNTAIEQLIYSREFNNRFGVYTVPFPTYSPETKLTWDPSAISTK
jgi:hypothetical protein